MKSTVFSLKWWMRELITMEWCETETVAPQNEYAVEQNVNFYWLLQYMREVLCNITTCTSHLESFPIYRISSKYRHGEISFQSPVWCGNNSRAARFQGQRLQRSVCTCAHSFNNKPICMHIYSGFQIRCPSMTPTEWCMRHTIVDLQPIFTYFGDENYGCISMGNIWSVAQSKHFGWFIQIQHS